MSKGTPSRPQPVVHRTAIHQVLHPAHHPDRILLAAGTDERPPLCVDLVRAKAALFIALIDPDGARPKEERARERRKLHIGKETADGLIPLNGYLMAEPGAGLKRLIDAHLRSHSFSDPDTDPEVSFGDHLDDRTIDQKRHDIFASIINATRWTARPR